MSKIKSLNKVKTTGKNINLLYFPNQNYSDAEQKTMYKNIKTKFNEKKFHMVNKFKSNIEQFKKKNSQMKIYSWNVNSLHACIFKRDDHFVNFLDSEKPDILIFNETKLNESREQECKEKLLETFSFPFVHFVNSEKKKGQSGVGIASKIIPSQVYEGIMSQEHDGFGRVLTFDQDYFQLVSCYTPNSGEGLSKVDYRTNSWEPYFRNQVKVLSEDKPVILGGDLNFANKSMDIYSTEMTDVPGFSPAERREANQLLKDYNFIDSYRLIHPNEIKQSFYSQRFQMKSKGKGWRLDQFICTNDCFDKDELKTQVDRMHTEPIELDAFPEDIVEQDQTDGIDKEKSAKGIDKEKSAKGIDKEKVNEAKEKEDKDNNNEKIKKEEFKDRKIDDSQTVLDYLTKNKSQKFNGKFKIIESNIHSHDGSDHTPISLVIKFLK